MKTLVRYEIGAHPNRLRKGIYLYRVRGTEAVAIARFMNRADADEFAAYLQAIDDENRQTEHALELIRRSGLSMDRDGVVRMRTVH